MEHEINLNIWDRREIKELIKKLNVKLVGHYRYYGVSYNSRNIGPFLHFTQKYLCKALNRRKMT